MKRTIALLVTGTMLSPAAAEEINRTLDAHPNSHVTVYNTAGSVEIEGWSRQEVEVTGDLGEDVEEFVFKRDQKNVTIKVKAPSGNKSWHDIASDLHIRVPKDSSIDVATISADIDVTGVHGEQSLQAISGDVETEMLKGDLRIESVSGDIDVEGNGKAGNIELNTVSGDINAYKLGGTLEAVAVSGDIAIDEGGFGRVALETVNGEISFRGGLGNDGRFNAESVNGEVDIEFTGQLSARFDIETFNGTIDNCFGPEPQRTSRYAPGWSLSFTEGDGDGRVEIATLNGDLTLCRD